MLISRDLIKNKYLIRPIRSNEINDYIKAMCNLYHPRYFQVQKKFIDWAFNSPFKEMFVKEDELTIMAAFNSSNNTIESTVGFLPINSFINKKKNKSLWDIQYINLSKTPGLALEVLRKLNSITEIFCGNNLNKKCFRSYKRVFDEKNYLPEVNRKIAILNSKSSEILFNQENDKTKSDFFKNNNVKTTACEIYHINELENISEQFWEDHLNRFLNTSDRSIKYINWRFLKHPYLKYDILSLDSQAKKGLAIVRVEKLKNSNFNVLRILDLMPCLGFEKEIQNLVLLYGKKKNCVIADFFCSFEDKANEICFSPFIDFLEHKKYDIPYRLQPIEIIDRKSFNLFINPKEKENFGINKIYTTKTDGEMDLYFSGKGLLLENENMYN